MYEEEWTFKYYTKLDVHMVIQWFQYVYHEYLHFCTMFIGISQRNNPPIFKVEYNHVKLVHCYKNVLSKFICVNEVLIERIFEWARVTVFFFSIHPTLFFVKKDNYYIFF